VTSDDLPVFPQVIAAQSMENPQEESVSPLSETRFNTSNSLVADKEREPWKPKST